MFLTIFPPLLCPRANCSRLSSLICSFLKSNLNDLLPSLFTKGQSERFAQVAQNKGATVSDSLTSLFKKELKCDSLKKRAKRTFALSLTKIGRFAQNTDEQIPNPGTQSL